MPEQYASFPVLTVKQPWAWAISYGKDVENRSWETRYRGPLWLHAGARSGWDGAGGRSSLVVQAWDRHLRENVPGWPGLPGSGVALNRKTTLMPFGAVTALVEVKDCHHSDECRSAPLVRPARLCSPWAIGGQWHWELANVRPLATPVPHRGALGLWRLPLDVEAAVRSQLGESNA